MGFVTGVTYPNRPKRLYLRKRLIKRLSEWEANRWWTVSTELRVLAVQEADFYRIFSNATRLRILWALVDRELSVGEIAAVAETSLQNTSQHLHLMQDKGILASRRESQTVYYRIADFEMVKRYILPLEEFCLHLQAKRRPK